MLEIIDEVFSLARRKSSVWRADSKMRCNTLVKTSKLPEYNVGFVSLVSLYYHFA
jgi:hypothetical protein